MGLLFGISAALLWGLSDFCTSRVANQTDSWSLSRTMLVGSMVSSVALVFIVPSHLTQLALLTGVLSGISNTGAIVVVYRGFARASLGVVSPICAVLGVILPTFADFLRGRRLPLMVTVGIAIGVFAIAASAYTPTRPGEAKASLEGVGLAVIGGCLFGMTYFFMNLATREEGAWPVLIQRLFGLVVLGGIAVARREKMLPIGRPLKFGLAGGFVAGAALTFVQLGFRVSAAGPVVVAASQYAGVGVLLAWVFAGEKLRWWQTVGVVTAAVGVGLMAAA
jgi:drug/metabolite transporter (DMT)-like permease